MTNESASKVLDSGIERGLNRDDLIVIAGAGGFIAGSIARYFHELGYTRIRAIDRKPLPEWYQRVPGRGVPVDGSEREGQRHPGGGRRRGSL